MFGLLHRSNGKKITRAATRPRLAIEMLESRDCPSITFGGGLGGGTGFNMGAPSITLASQVQPNHEVQLSGTVTDSNPADVAVAFSGAVTANTTTDTYGHFSLTTAAASLGAVYAVGTDQQSRTSNTAIASIAIAAPVVTLAVDAVGPNTVWLSGTLTGVDYADQTITLTGAVQDTTLTDADGYFTYETSSSVVGEVDASATDLWGQSSNAAAAIVPTYVTPQISLTALVLPGQEVQLSGTVSDNHPANVTVAFSGAVSDTTTTDAYGNFSFTTTQASLGTVYAVGTDALQISTNTASATIATDAPVVTLSVVAVGPNFDAVSGTLTGIDYADQTITLTGAVNDSAVTDANGNFTYVTSSSVVGAIDVSATDLWGQPSNTAEVTIAAYTAPEITLAAQVLPGGQVQLSGAVTDDQPQGVTVTFSGTYSGSTTTDADGNFSITTNQASLGTVFAVGQDADLQLTNAASASVAVPAPVLTLAVTGATQDTVTLSGTLTGMDYAGQTVTLSGAVQDAVVTDSDGDFTVTENVSAAGTIQAVVVDPWGQSSNTPDVAVQSMTNDGAPQLSLDVLVLPGRQVQLTGTVIGDQPAGITVTFSGAVTGTTTTDANGFYSFWATATSPGTVSAVGVDQNQQSTNTATASIAVNAPTITLAATNISQGYVTLSGTLSDIDAAGETINITGASVSSVVTDAKGNFSFTCAVADLDEVDVSATDFWGETSNTAAIDLSVAPVITSFSAVRQTSLLYTFEGDVVAEGAPGITVVFGGLTSISGKTTTVLSDSSFDMTEFLDPGETGTATAQTSAFQGRPVSNVAQAIVR